MKKILVALLLCSLLYVTPAYAINLSSCRYEEGAFSLSLPADWILFTPDIADEDPNLSIMDTNGETLRNKMLENNVVFNSVYPDLSQEVTVSWFKNIRSRVTFDYNILQPDALSEQAQSIIDHEFDGDINVPSYLSFDKYHNGQALFLRFKGVIMKGETSYAEFIQYSTVINGNACNISLHTYGQSLTAKDEVLLQEIIDSLSFDEVLKKTADRKITLTLIGIIVLTIFMIASAVWSIIRYRKKMKN
ncbi:MAG: hypothetical protein CVU87_02015 [Firmicutes bacterium HGW-Firmicutes-12]|jgi:hypothetical protein|nr:MAG: hypothetical protein CVU87_02015 [Firmicutes bacterium HGW-Firmicutes-12]